MGGEYIKEKKMSKYYEKINILENTSQDSSLTSLTKWLFQLCPGFHKNASLPQ